MIQLFLRGRPYYNYGYNNIMRILVVEDDHKIAGAIKRGLEQEQFAVDAVYDGKEGLGFAINEPYDLIILDRMLPNIGDGLQICRALRDHKIHTPVLLLTAKTEVSDRVQGLEAGADDYLVKPFAFEELLARIRALLRRPQEHLGNELRAGDLRLNTHTFQVTRDGQTIDLSAKEYALLEYFMRHPGQTLSKDMIIAHVWDYDADVLPNTVEVYVGYLRNKLGTNAQGKPHIETVRGFGYRLRGETR